MFSNYPTLQPTNQLAHKLTKVDPSGMRVERVDWDEERKKGLPRSALTDGSERCVLKR